MNNLMAPTPPKLTIRNPMVSFIIVWVKRLPSNKHIIADFA